MGGSALEIYFDNDGPKITIKESDPKEVKANGQKIATYSAAIGAAQAFTLALIGICFSVLIASDTNVWQQFFAGMGLVLGIMAIILYFVHQYRNSCLKETDFLNQQIWTTDQSSMNRLVGKDFVLSPPTGNGYGKLRIFYKDKEDMVGVWYSNGTYHYQPSKGESSIDFLNGTVMVPNFVWVPGISQKESEQKGDQTI